jgi:hypothetical protein
MGGFLVYTVFGFVLCGILMIILKYSIKSAIIEALQELKK